MHKFRFGLGAKWKHVSIEGNSVQFKIDDKVITEIPVNAIEEIQISRQVGGVYGAKIKGRNLSIKLNTNAPEQIATPYQAVDTFAELLETLRNHPENKATYIIGSNLILLTGISFLAISIIGLILGLFLIGDSGGRSIRMISSCVFLIVISATMVAGGRAKKHNSIDSLPYGLFAYIP